MLFRSFNAPAGYLGPIGIEAAPHPKKPGTLVILDKALEGRANLISGANKEGYHLRNVTPMRDFKPTLIADVRNINEGEPCPCDGSPLRLGKAVEIGHIFKLGYKYTESMDSRVLDSNGKEVKPIMGCYGIGIERILTAAIESSAAQFAAKSATNPGAPSLTASSSRVGSQDVSEAYVLHPSIAPFHVIVTITNIKEQPLVDAGEKIAADLTAAGIDVLLDDRDERAGVKFKDADLIGVPYRINIGRGIAENKVELVNRLTAETLNLSPTDAVQHLHSLLKPLTRQCL